MGTEVEDLLHNGCDSTEDGRAYRGLPQHNLGLIDVTVAIREADLEMRIDPIRARTGVKRETVARRREAGSYLTTQHVGVKSVL